MPEIETTREDEVAVVIGDEGALLLGPAAALDRLDNSAELSPITPELLRRAGNALSGIENYQKQSRRWLKLDADSAKYLQVHGINPKDLQAGVVRVKDLPQDLSKSSGGRLLKHLKFERAGLFTPAAPMALASMMQQAAVEKQMEQMQDYLERIDAKIDAVLRFQKDTLAGEIDGIAEVLAEALLVLEGTEEVTDTQWATVQHLHADLSKLQGRVLRHLNAVAEKMAESKTSPGKVKVTFQETNSEARSWLYELARTVQLQNQMYVLQLNRVDAVEGEVAKDYAAVASSREKRATRLVKSLSTMADTAHKLGDFGALSKATALNSPRAVREVNRFFGQLRDFSAAADLEVEGVEDLEPVRRIAAAREFASSGAAKTREAAATAQHFAAETRGGVTQRARQAWGATRGAVEGAARGKKEGPAKGTAEAGDPDDIHHDRHNSIE